MRRIYFITMVVVLMIAISIVSYGAYLNTTDEKQIALRLESRTVPLIGAVAKFRKIKPVFNLNTVNLTSKSLADAVALIDGRINQAFVTKNSSVTVDDPLFELVNEDIPLKIKQADSAIVRAEAQLLQAKNSFERYEQLKEFNATSMEKYDEAKLNYEAAVVNLTEAQLQKEQLLIQDARQVIYAPISGEVLILYKQIGAFVTAGTPVALIGDFSYLNFSLPVEDSFAQKISVGEQFELYFKNSRTLQKAYDTEYAAGNLGNLQAFPVVVLDIIPSLNQPAQLRKIIFQIDNRAGILEQQTYNGVLLSRSNPDNILTVPLKALSGSSVFVVNPDNTLQRRNVSVGADDGRFIEVLSGLSEGDIVITSAPKGLEDGMEVSVTLEDSNE